MATSLFKQKKAGGKFPLANGSKKELEMKHMFNGENGIDNESFKSVATENNEAKPIELNPVQKMIA